MKQKQGQVNIAKELSMDGATKYVNYRLKTQASAKNLVNVDEKGENKCIFVLMWITRLD